VRTKADINLITKAGIYNWLGKYMSLFWVVLFTHTVIHAQEKSPHKIKIAAYQNQIDSLERVDADFNKILEVKKKLAWAMAIYEREDYTYLVKLINELKAYIPEVDHFKYEAEILTIAGLIDSKRGNHENALKNHFKALSIKEKHNSSGQAFNHEQIGVVLSSRLNLKEALIKYKDARAIHLQQEKDPPKLLQRIGRTFLIMGDLDSSQHYLEKSIVRAEELNSLLVKGTSIAALAQVSIEKGEYEESIKYLDQSVDIRKNRMTVDHEITLNRLYAINYLELGNLALAREYINKALQIVRDSNSYGGLSQVYQVKVQIDKAQGYQDSVVINYDYWIKYLDSFYLIENNQNFNTVYQELGVSHKEDLIQRKDKELLIINRRNRNIIGMAVISVLALGVLSFLYRKKVSYERTIIEQNSTIKKALQEKSTRCH